jgi:hypothetical protein
LTGKYNAVPTPPNVTLGKVTSTQANISWEQDNRDTYSGFEISYTHNGPCFVNKTNVSELQNSTFRHAICDLEENNDYTLVVYAVNRAGRSLRTASNTKKFKTRSGGKQKMYDKCRQYYKIIVYCMAAPTGRPQLRVGSSTSTSAHFLWDRINCTERNSEIVGYNISYYPSMNSTYKISDNITGTSEMERRYTATQLTPITNYTFMITAVSNYNDRSFSLAANITYQTDRTSGKSSLHINSIVIIVYNIIEVIFFLNGRIYANNSVVDVNDIGGPNYEALLCLTNARNCCGYKHGDQGEWYLPSGVPANTNSIYFNRNRGPSVLRLTSILNDNLFPDGGVFRCEIPDASGLNQSVYIGIYPSDSGVGEPLINKFPEYSSYNNSQILTCTSTGGPATNVEWWKDDQLLGNEYEQHKRIANQTTAEYQSTLFLGQSRPDKVIGNYTCRVSNARNEVTKTIHLHGSNIIT